MVGRRIWIAVALASVAAACSDGTGPAATATGPTQAEVVAAPSPLHFLRQAASAPKLQTYQVSFWAKRGTQTTIFVNYRPAPGQWLGDPFLRFRIPINGLVAGADGVPLGRGDSVRITLTIDTVLFKLDFQPSGVVFSRSSPAQLAVWYQDADPDLNGDGVVDAVDQSLKQQLAIWIQDNRSNPWRQLASKNDATQQYVAAEVPHFSEMAVAW